MPFINAACVAVADEYEKNHDLIQEDINDLRKWVDLEKHLPEFKDSMLMHFYHSCYFDMENAKDCIEAYHTSRLNSPEIFSERSFTRPDLLKAMDTAYLIVLPVNDSNGYRLVYNGLRVTDPAHFKYIECNRVAFMYLDACLEKYAPQRGSVMIMDMKGTKVAHLAKMSLSVMRKSLHYQQEANPIRLHAIHIINVVPWIDKLMALVRPFMKKELLALLHFHSEGLESLYEHIPRECLPKDLGGSLKSLEELHGDAVEFLKGMSSFFEEDEKARIAMVAKEKGSKKKKTIKPEDIMFEKLDID